MEKMVGIINDNLLSVINGIKTHKSDTEASLNKILADMEDKLKIASEYKASVEVSRSTIINLENEISILENDLEELKTKFEGRNFTELLEAGNREINEKIIDKKRNINVEKRKILDITQKAHELKDEIMRLKDYKLITEDVLRKASILDNYYESKIMSIINFAKEHISDFENSKLGIADISDDMVDDEILNENIDDSVFEEIDEISTSKNISDELLNEVMDSSYDFSYEDDEEVETKEKSLTDDLDAIISVGDNITVEEIKEDELVNNIFMDEAIKKDADNEVLPHETYELAEEELNDPDTLILVDEEPMLDEEDEQETDMLIDEPKLDENNNDFTSSDGLVLDDFVPDKVEEAEDDLNEVSLIPTDEEELNSKEVQSLMDELANEAKDIDSNDTFEINFEDEKNSIKEIPEIDFEENAEEVDLFDYYGINEEEYKNTFEGLIPNKNISESMNLIEDNEGLIAELKECNLEPNRLSQSDLNILGHNFSKDKMREFISVMRKHNIGIGKIYDAINVYCALDTDELDKILSTLDKANIKEDTISFIFNRLDKVNIEKLEQIVNVSNGANIVELLYEAMPYDGEINLAKLLNVSESDINTLRQNSDPDEFKMMNMFPEIVLVNYKMLEKFNIDNLVDCITKHPHRFLMDPDKFHDILDKYDPDDLVRCINKNCAVIDKL